MNRTFKIVYRALVVAVLLWTALSYRAEQQAQGAYMTLQAQCIQDYAALPAGSVPPEDWNSRCALDYEGSQISLAMEALDEAQRPFLISAVTCVFLLALMAGAYAFQRVRGRGPDATP